jgi:hypothetical protein
MFLFWNNNPKGLKIGDCVIRAISAALNQTWERTYIDLCIEGFLFADMPNSNTVFASYLRNKGFKRYSVPDTCPDCYTIGQFADDHPTGTYIVCTGSHVVCIKDSKVMDNWDSTGETVAYYFLKE